GLLGQSRRLDDVSVPRRFERLAFLTPIPKTPPKFRTLSPRLSKSLAAYRKQLFSVCTWAMSAAKLQPPCGKLIMRGRQSTCEASTSELDLSNQNAPLSLILRPVSNRRCH